MAAHGKHVGAVWVESGLDFVEFVHRSHWLLINFFDDIPALQFREVRGINYNSVDARRQIKTFGQIGCQFTDPHGPERVRIAFIFIRCRIRRIWLRQRIAGVWLSRLWDSARGLSMRGMRPTLRRYTQRFAVALWLQPNL